MRFGNFAILWIIFLSLFGRPVFAGPTESSLRSSAASLTLPADIFKEMESSGMGKWIELEAKAGNSLTVGQPLVCRSCGGGYIPRLENVEQPKCTNCGYPKDALTKTFQTPKKVLPNKNLAVFVLNEVDGKVPLSPELTKRISRLMDMELTACKSCGSMLNPEVVHNCYSCGTAVEEDQKKPAKKTTTTITADEDMPKPAPRKTTLKGAVTEPLATSRMSTTTERTPRTPRIPRKIVGGVGAGVALVAVAYGIGYIMTKDKVHHSIGTVEVISLNEVRITVPGFIEPITLMYDPQFKDSSGKYTKNTLDPYLAVDTVDVWWTQSDGVVQILPIDLSSEIDALINGEVYETN